MVAERLTGFRSGTGSGAFCAADGAGLGGKRQRTGGGKKPGENGGERRENAPDRDVTLSTALHTAPPGSLSRRCTRYATLRLTNLLVSTLKLSREPLLIRKFVSADEQNP